MQSKRDQALLISVLAVGVIGAGSWFVFGGSGAGATTAMKNAPTERRQRTEVVEARSATRSARERAQATPQPARRRAPRPDEHRSGERRDRVQQEKAKPKKVRPSMG